MSLSRQGSNSFVPASGDYDEVLVLSDGTTFDETATGGDTVAGGATLTAGKDYQVHSIRTRLLAAGEEFEQTSDTGPIPVHADLGVFWNQLSIRNSYAERGSDNEIPSGVAYDEISHVQVSGHYQDKTNGVAGSFDGLDTDRVFVTDVAAMPTWSGSLEEGTEMSMHWKVEGITDGEVQLYATNYLFVTEES